MRSAVFIGLLAASLAGLLAVGCMPTPYMDADDDDPPAPDHATTSKTKSSTLDAGTTTKKSTTTEAPPVVGDTTQSTPSSGSTPGTAPGSGGSDAGTAAVDAGPVTPGVMSASGYEQNSSRAAQTGACSQSDIGYYEGLLNVKGTTYGDMEQEMRDRDTRCASCIFSNIDDTLWGPVVMESATTGFFNWASCYALAPGGNAACGNEVQQYYDCLDDVCSAYSDDALTNCQNIAAADTTSCGGLTFNDCADLDSLNTACATDEAALNFACGN